MKMKTYEIVKWIAREWERVRDDKKNEPECIVARLSDNNKTGREKLYEIMYLSFKSMCIFCEETMREIYWRKDEDCSCQFMFHGADFFFRLVGIPNIKAYLIIRKFIQNLFTKFN